MRAIRHWAPPNSTLFGGGETVTFDNLFVRCSTIAAHLSMTSFNLRLLISSPVARVVALAGILAIFSALSSAPARATSVVPPKFEELVNKSDYIVRAVVKSVTSEHREKNGKRKIYTRVELDVREVIAGTPPSPLVLEMLGGKIGDEELRIDGAPEFHVGDEDILFVRNNGRQFFPLTAVMYGRYPILKDRASGREYVVRANKVPLTSTSQVSQPMTESAAAAPLGQTQASEPALTPAQFSAHIRSVVTTPRPPSLLN